MPKLTTSLFIILTSIGLLSNNQVFAQAIDQNSIHRIVDAVVAQYKTPIPAGRPDTQQRVNELRKTLETTGQVGFDYLIDLAKQAQSKDLEPISKPSQTHIHYVS